MAEYLGIVGAEAGISYVETAIKLGIPEANIAVADTCEFMREKLQDIYPTLHIVPTAEDIPSLYLGHVIITTPVSTRLNVIEAFAKRGANNILCADSLCTPDQESEARARILELQNDVQLRIAFLYNASHALEHCLGTFEGSEDLPTLLKITWREDRTGDFYSPSNGYIVDTIPHALALALHAGKKLKLDRWFVESADMQFEEYVHKNAQRAAQKRDPSIPDQPCSGASARLLFSNNEGGRDVPVEITGSYTKPGRNRRIEGFFDQHASPLTITQFDIPADETELTDVVTINGHRYQYDEDKLFETLQAFINDRASPGLSTPETALEITEMQNGILSRTR